MIRVNFILILVFFSCRLFAQDVYSAKAYGVEFIGSMAHVERALNEADKISTIKIGKKLLDKLSTQKARFYLVDWQEHHKIYHKIDHTRHMIEIKPNNWNDLGYNFVIFFYSDEPEDRVLDLYHPQSHEVEGRVHFTSAFYRQLLKSQIMLELKTPDNYSNNYLIDQTLKFEKALFTE